MQVFGWENGLHPARAAALNAPFPRDAAQTSIEQTLKLLKTSFCKVHFGRLKLLPAPKHSKIKI